MITQSISPFKGRNNNKIKINNNIKINSNSNSNVKEIRNKCYQFFSFLHRTLKVFGIIFFIMSTTTTTKTMTTTMTMTTKMMSTILLSSKGSSRRNTSYNVVTAFRLFGTKKSSTTTDIIRRRYDTSYHRRPAGERISFLSRLYETSERQQQQEQQQHQQQVGDSDFSNNQQNKITITNQDLAQRRVAISRAKRASRERTLQDRAEKNMRIKRLLHTDSRNTTSALQQDIDVDNDTTNRLYAVKVWVDDTLREEMRLTGREKRGRVFIEKQSTSTHTLKGLQQEMYEFFRALKKDTFILSASLPTITSDGNIEMTPPNISSSSLSLNSSSSSEDIEELLSSSSSSSTSSSSLSWPIETDEDVMKTFQIADDFFMKHQQEQMSKSSSVSSSSSSAATTSHEMLLPIGLMKRPAIQINVLKNPNAPPPPPKPFYLQDMVDPKDTDSMTMISFYSFPPNGIDDAEKFAFELRKRWKPFHVLGRVYVAEEGVNAQMSIPTNVLSNFMDCCRSIPELGTYMENDINIDPKPLSMEEFATAGVPVNGRPAPPFRNLHVRVRAQIVADGLSRPLNWQSAGYDMPPMEWHEKLKKAREIKQQQQQQQQDEGGGDSVGGNSTNHDNETLPILLDCRNTYETDVGIFEGAEPLGTENFRDSWDVLKERLADTPKDAPIMTYCTGGIRCVKVGAYLTQELGFTNVSRLAGGIIAYDRTLNEQQQQQQLEEEGKNEVDNHDDHRKNDDKIDTNIVAVEESMFKGTNFVFDGRLGRPITEDELGKCITCGTLTSLVSNCRNDNCHIRMIQCAKCRTEYHGTCSHACKNRVLNGGGGGGGTVTTVTGTGKKASSSEGTALHQQDEEKEKIVYRSLDEYSSGHSSPVPSIYREMELNTQAFIPSGSHMVSGGVQGRILTQFASMTREGRILELGTFSGYATACFLEGAMKVANILSSTTSSDDNDDDDERTFGTAQSGPYVLSLERDVKAFNLAAAQLEVITKYGFGETAAEQLRALRKNTDSLQEIQRYDTGDEIVSFSMSNNDNDGDEKEEKNTYTNIIRAGCDLWRVTDALATIESIAATGTGTETTGQNSTSSSAQQQQQKKQMPAPFDIVFVDADKTRLLEYVEACLINDKVLKRGGLIIVDNVLWKGLVLEASSGNFFSSTSTSDDGDTDDDDATTATTSTTTVDKDELRKNRRARKLATQMHQFNSKIVQDDRVEIIMLPIRDGLSILRKK